MTPLWSDLCQAPYSNGQTHKETDINPSSGCFKPKASQDTKANCNLRSIGKRHLFKHEETPRLFKPPALSATQPVLYILNLYLLAQLPEISEQSLKSVSSLPIAKG